MILTVFTPVYNRAAFLPAIYDSLLEQDTTDFEWLIVDDGSTDNTQEEALKLAACNPPFPVRYIHKENGGKHTAINVHIISELIVPKVHKFRTLKAYFEAQLLYP